MPPAPFAPENPAMKEDVSMLMTPSPELRSLFLRNDFVVSTAAADKVLVAESRSYMRAAQCSLMMPIGPGIHAPPFAPGPRKPVEYSVAGCFCQGFDPLYDSRLHAAPCVNDVQYCSKALRYQLTDTMGHLSKRRAILVSAQGME